MLTIFLLLSTLIFASRTRAQEQPPVGQWNFDEGSGGIARDSSGRGNDGTIHNATWVAGKVGSALHFDGVKSWVQILSNPTLSGLSQITLEAWIKLDAFSSSNIKGIISKSTGVANPTPGDEYTLALADSDTTLGFHVSNYNFIAVGNVYNAITEDNRWYHVAATWSGSEYLVYVDGIARLSGTCTPQATHSNTVDVQIGRHGSFSWTYFHGVIDEVKIYDYSRTSEEILNDYNSFMPSPSPFWTEWWFWAIIALGVVTGVFAFTTVHYHKKASIPKDSKVTSTKPAQKKDFKVCSNCGASLPLDSVFCGKCGTRQE